MNRTTLPWRVLRRCGSILAVATLAATVVAVPAAPAGAHAALAASTPESGSQLAAAPGVVEIRFSEPLIADLSMLKVTDPLGDVWERTSIGDQSMAAELDTTAAGVYAVDWTTVSPIDGHTLRGSFRFGVGVDPGHVESVTSAPSRAGLVVAVARAIEYAALLLAIGMLLITRLARRGPALRFVRLQPRWALAVALLAGIAVIIGEALVAATAPSLSAVSRYLSAEPGGPRLLRVAAEATAMAVAFTTLRWPVLIVTVVAVWGLSAAGHAAATEPAWWGISVDALHLVAAGLWAGGIAALAFVRPPEGWRVGDGRALLERFSPVAIAAFVGTVAFGSLRAFQELVGPGDLIATSYGQVLLVKLGAVALMVPLSWRAWRLRSPRPRAESFLAVVSVAAAALLAAYPVPPQRAAEDVALAAADASSGLPGEDDLVLASTVGESIVGVTLRPGRPGRNEVIVYLLPVEGAEAAEGLGVTLSADGDERTLDVCGVACRRTEVVLEGDQRLEVWVEGEERPAVLDVPALPAPDATDVVELMSETMGALESVAYEEVFGPADPPVRSSAAMVAPDRMRFEVHTNDRLTIRIGDTFYRRREGEPWEVDTGPTLAVPQYIWDYPKVAPRAVGGETLRGTATSIVTFFVNEGDLPVWYRLWIDERGLVHQAEMRARGHFMDHIYSDFNEPMTIRAPKTLTDDEQ